MDIELPPLRIEKKIFHFWPSNFISMYSKELEEKVYSISGEAIKVLMEYHWPGKCKGTGEYHPAAITLSRSDTIVPADLPEAPDKN